MQNSTFTKLNHLIHRITISSNRIIGKLIYGTNNSAIIMLHHIVANEDDKISYSCQTTIVEFEKFLEHISQNKKVISMDEFINLRKRHKLSNNIVITFDDVPDNFYTIGYPLLCKYNLPFTLYVTTGFLNQKGYLSKDNLETLSQNALCTIAAHSITHPKLTASQTDSQSEIEQSKLILEKLIKKEVRHFAYPYVGFTSVSSKNINQVKKSRYVSAVSSVSGIMNNVSIESAFYLPRISSRHYMSQYKQY